MASLPIIVEDEVLDGITPLSEAVDVTRIQPIIVSLDNSSRSSLESSHTRSSGLEVVDNAVVRASYAITLEYQSALLTAY
jgi:hypothetical protein